MKYILAVILLVSQNLFAQQTSTTDKKTAAALKETINYLSDDRLEGRRTGSAGEKLAYTYIEKKFRSAGIKPLKPRITYIQPFDVNDGKEIGKQTSFLLNGSPQELNRHYFPFPWSANISNFKFTEESTNVEYYDLTALLAENENNPHFDYTENIIAYAKQAAGRGIKLVIVKHFPTAKNFSFDPKDKNATLSIPVIYMFPRDRVPYQQLPPGAKTGSELTVAIAEKKRIGHNVIGYIDNKAPHTIILGAHYDHLGYGEDHNSLYAGKDRMIHNGADDNASGTAALIELGKWLKISRNKNYNYILAAFSGEELGLYGSKYFSENSGIDLNKVNYMINMDMVGRLNETTKGLTIGGFGTSPTWGQLISNNDPYFKINTDSSGTGPSDHTSFYRKGIPVLFFFTGSHSDYHKPGDDADKINYAGELQIIRYIQNIISKTDKMNKLSFTKTREVAMGKSSFKVSLGIMPDYTYNGSGVLVDGVSDARPAQKAGIKTGDVLFQIGEHKFNDVRSYMDALNKFNKGESTEVKLKRGKEDLTLPVTF
ncbi:MAG: M20/M25/M40 family metallo-hydrolase [Ferruginibacter sp.]